MFLFLSYLLTFQSRFTKNLVPFGFSAPARCPESVSEISSKLLLLIEADLRLKRCFAHRIGHRDHLCRLETNLNFSWNISDSQSHICQNSTFPPLPLKSLCFVLLVWHPAQTVRLLLLLSFTKFTPLPPVSDQGFGGQHVPGKAVSKS